MKRIALVMVVGIIALVGFAGGAGATALKVTPETVDLARAGGSFTVHVAIEDVTNLGGFQFDLNYDPSVLQITAATNVTVAAFLGSSGRTVTPLGPDIDNTTGKVTFAAYSFGEAAGPSGSGDLAAIVFTVLDQKVGSLDLNAVQVVDPESAPIALDAVEDGSLMVSGTYLMSLGAGGTQSNKDSGPSSISSDGRCVAFASAATNLVPGDLNRKSDIFVYDRATEQTGIVSVNLSGGPGNHHSYTPSISGDGQLIAFSSRAKDLVLGDTNSKLDVFVYDRLALTTQRVSVSSLELQANGDSSNPRISRDGRYVVFVSSATNLVPGDTNKKTDVFVHDSITGETSRVSVDSAGNQANQASSQPAISGDGRYIAFTSSATNLVAGDTNKKSDIFVHDQETGITTRVSVSSTGEQAIQACSYPSISDDGQFVAFQSTATNLVPGDKNKKSDIFVHNLATGETTLVSVATTGAQGNNASTGGSISADGRYVAFASTASNLVTGDTNRKADIFLRDRTAGTTVRVSVNSAGAQANNTSFGPSVSADGSAVAYHSSASNLVTGDTKKKKDVFVTVPTVGH